MNNIRDARATLRRPTPVLCAAIFLLCTTQLVTAFCLFSCDPTEENAKQAVTNLLRGQFQTPANVTDFKKTNGARSAFAGVDYYEMRYEARFDLPQGLVPKPANPTVAEQLMTGSNAMMKLAELGMLEPVVCPGQDYSSR